MANPAAGVATDGGIGSPSGYSGTVPDSWSVLTGTAALCGTDGLNRRGLVLAYPRAGEPGRAYGSVTWASTVRNETCSNSSRWNAVPADRERVAAAPPAGAETPAGWACPENGVATGRGRTNVTSVPMPDRALVSP